MADWTHRLFDNIISELDKQRMLQESGRRATKSNLKQISFSLDGFYVYHKLKLYCEYLTYSKFLPDKVVGDMAEDFKTLKENLLFARAIADDNPAIKAYLLVMQLLESMDESANSGQSFLAELEFFLKNNEGSFNQEEKVVLYSYISNYSIWSINQGIAIYNKKYLQITIKIINLKYFNNHHNKGKRQGSHKGGSVLFIPSGIYKNIVCAALRLKDDTDAAFFKEARLLGAEIMLNAEEVDRLSWTEAFIELYKEKLDKRTVDIYYAYCKSLLHFEKTEFLRAYQVLSTCSNSREPFMNLNIKVLEAQALYELSTGDNVLLYPKKVNIDFDFEKFLDKFKKQLYYEKMKRKQLQYHMQYFEDFYQYFRELVRFTENHSRYNKIETSKKNNRLASNLLRDLHDEEKKIIAKEWFLEKVNNLQL